MASHPNRSTKIRPREHLRAAGKLYPDAWKQIDVFRSDKGRGLPDWPNWCFLPMAAYYSMVSAETGDNRLGIDLIADVSRLSALGTWRVTQGIYQYDNILLDAIWETPVTGDIPHDVLYRLPEWCVYIETPGKEHMGSKLHGFWCHLEYDIEKHQHELRLLLDTEELLIPVPLHIGQHTLKECVDQALDTSKTHAATYGLTIPSGVGTHTTHAIEPIISLVLYLCSKNAEIEGTPENPKPKKTRKGWRLFPAKKPKTWGVGVRIGAKLRKSYYDSQTEQGSGEGNTKRPHIRRAHWHTYWKGTGDDKKPSLKWLPPIAVNVDDEGDLPATIREV